VENSTDRISAPEAYLEGFSDGYHGVPSREDYFRRYSFGDRYTEAYDAGREKKEAEDEIEMKKRLKMPPVNQVDFYEEGVFVAAVVFAKKWQARLFHLILNRSLNHAGVRKY